MVVSVPFWKSFLASFLDAYRGLACILAPLFEDTYPAQVVMVATCGPHLHCCIVRPYKGGLSGHVWSPPTLLHRHILLEGSCGSMWSPPTLLHSETLPRWFMCVALCGPHLHRCLETPCLGGHNGPAWSPPTLLLMLSYVSTECCFPMMLVTYCPAPCVTACLHGTMALSLMSCHMWY